MMALAILILSFLLVLPFSSATDTLLNPDFESPPTNITTTDNSTFLLLTKFNTIPGWSFNGTVRYVTAGPNISLPGNKGHAIQLGKGAYINQTFNVGKDVSSYALTFSLAQGSSECFNKSIAVNVSVPGRSRVFSLQRHYGKETWESHAFVVTWSNQLSSINIVIRSASLDSDPTCGPIVDTFMLKIRRYPFLYGGNSIWNAEFEEGPEFIQNSKEGILLSDEDDENKSVLQRWSVLGTIKYINSKLKSMFDTYTKEKAAIELVSGNSSGILQKLYFEAGTTFDLEFMMGDANNSCVGELIVYVQIDNEIQNFTMLSNGTGSYRNCSMTYTAEYTGDTSLTFLNLNQSQTSDHVLCGPVIDNVALLLRSDGLGSYPHNALMLTCLFFIAAIIYL